MTIYDNPKEHNLKIVYEEDLDNESYSFNLFVIFQDTQTGEYFVGRDSGCSCPSPFEDYHDRSELEPLNESNCRNIETNLINDSSIEPLSRIELLETIRSLMKKKKGKKHETER